MSLLGDQTDLDQRARSPDGRREGSMKWPQNQIPTAGAPSGKFVGWVNVLNVLIFKKLQTKRFDKVCQR